jgi:DNA-binding MarR family transcriptional regulator
VGGPLTEYQRITTGTPDLLLRPASLRYAGLTSAESSVLDTLIRLGVVTRESLAGRAGVSVADVDGVMERLVALGYAVAADETGESFRAVAQ